MLTVKRLSWMMIVVVFIGISFVPVNASIQTEDLWQKAVQNAAANQDYVPGKIHVRVEQMNGQGRLKSEEESWLVAKEGLGRQVKMECLKLFKNGKEATEKEREEYQYNISQKPDPKSSKRNLSFGTDDLNPFEPKVQVNVYYHPTDRREIIGQQECVIYEFTWRKSPGDTRQGTAWLAADTGIPLLLKYNLLEGPKHVKSYSATITYTIQDGLWYPETGQMEASGGFWFVKYQIRVGFTVSDYWKSEQNLQN